MGDGISKYVVGWVNGYGHEGSGWVAGLGMWETDLGK